jgi:antitoxin ParD1/3/4
MTTLTISLPESLREFVDRQVNTKGYGNVSEYFRTLLRDAQEREAEKRLEQLLIEGIESGADIEITPEYWEHKKKAILSKMRQKKSKARR